MIAGSPGESGSSQDFFFVWLQLSGSLLGVFLSLYLPPKITVETGMARIPAGSLSPFRDPGGFAGAVYGIIPRL